MKLFKTIAALLLTALWIAALSLPIGKLPPLGNFLSPGTGFWANAEPKTSAQNSFRPYRKDSVLAQTTIIFDKRLVPHIKANNDYALYYAQGYVQAYYRLWQMDIQSHAAAGRLSEIIGNATLSFDRHQRRKGMVWAAEKSLKSMEADSRTATMIQAYTNGVNAFIHSLDEKHLPLEYKLMNFRPEDWTPLKCALLMKYMADMLTGHSDDIALTYARQALSAQTFNALFPDKLSASQPVIPKGTVFPPAQLALPEIPDSNVFARLSATDTAKNLSAAQITGANSGGIGSNNWALSGRKTTSGYPILCNDPHLNLNLPSIWYECQLTAPDINCYGVSIPGAPGIVIGFNNDISWGLTNNYRDVKDYYVLKTDAGENHYQFDGQFRVFEKRIEKIVVKGRQPFIDTVRYAVQGPVEYDASFPDPSKSGSTLAMTWMAHQASNELLALYLLNRAKDYPAYVAAIQHFECPAQNFIYADTKGNIALWGQGRFINKWPEQGKFVMLGDTSATLWGESIPMSENPHVLNPPQGYLESANQQVTDSTYPYYYNGDFTEFRSWEITRFLSQEKKFNVADMMALQNNNWSVIAEKLQPFFNESKTQWRHDFPDYAGVWNDSLMPDSKTGAAFQIWWYFFYKNLWAKKFQSLPVSVFPSKEISLQLLLNHPDKLQQISETDLPTLVQKSGRETADSLKTLTREGRTAWYQIKNTTVEHLAKISAFSYGGLATGGSSTAINAMRNDHGPSWRMIVSMKPNEIEAWCSYPGGQSGNPGSPFYVSFLQHWVDGKYFKINFFQDKDYEQAGNARGAQ